MFLFLNYNGMKMWCSVVKAISKFSGVSHLDISLCGCLEWYEFIGINNLVVEGDSAIVIAWVSKE